ncbi:hypothetical protein G9A89_013290 [Geosiphon pyriformis]|nr:hypothetical protein G9A89_013290 [Geosiphon pyriformis]
MLEIDPKNVIREIGNFYNTLFSHPKENVELEVKNYVREFEVTKFSPTFLQGSLA